MSTYRLHRRLSIDLSNHENDGVPSLFHPDLSNHLLKPEQNLSGIKDQNDGGDVTLSRPARKPVEEFCVPYVQAVMFSSVLEDSITQLRILAECNNELRIHKVLADKVVLHGKKFQVEQPEFESWNDLSGINTKQLGCMQYKLDKLVADRKYITDLLTKIYVELSLTKCYHTLRAINKNIEDNEVYKINLSEEEARNKICRRDLLKQLRQQRNHIKSVAYETDLIVDQLKSRVEDAALHTQIRGNYIDNWQRARTEQHMQTIADNEAGPSDSIRYYRNRSEQEQRVHSEVELLVNTFISETLITVENWMNKYDTDMEKIDLKIAITKNKCEDMMTKRKEMEQMYADHEVLMKEWIQFKDDREKARLYRENMTNAALVVQAWWRGILVRFELGPYKPPKKPPAKPKGKKK